MANKLQHNWHPLNKGVVMNTTFAQSHQQVYSPMQFVLRDEEKNRIMQKVYSSEVFSEFVRQWGDAMTGTNAAHE